MVPPLEEALDAERTLELPSAERTMTDLAPVHADVAEPPDSAEPPKLVADLSRLAAGDRRPTFVEVPRAFPIPSRPSSLAPLAMDVATQSTPPVVDETGPRSPTDTTLHLPRYVGVGRALKVYAALGAVAAGLLGAIGVTNVVGRTTTPVIEVHASQLPHTVQTEAAATAILVGPELAAKKAGAGIVASAPASSAAIDVGDPNALGAGRPRRSDGDDPVASSSSSAQPTTLPPGTGLLRVGNSPVPTIDGWARHPAKDGTVLLTCGRHTVKTGLRVRLVDVPCGGAVTF